MTNPSPGGLGRLLEPATIAVVGASEKRGMSDTTVGNLRDAPVTLHLVHPRTAEAYGQATVPSLRAIDGPVDAVLALVGAERALDVVADAAAVGAGGVVVVASGFAEAGAAGEAMQHRLAAVARDAGLPVIGPNCTGFANVTRGIHAFTGTKVDVRAGGIALVSSSGYLMRSAMVAARERNLGIRIAISSGNEAVTALADYVDHFIDDDATSMICVVIEALADPEAFFTVAARARAASKPLLVVKLGRTETARGIVASHTGALTGHAWLTDVAFRSAGVLVARDIDDLMDQASVVSQFPAARWQPVSRVAVVGTSGGLAALVSDTIDRADVELPDLVDLRTELREHIAGLQVVNPLDLTGVTMARPGAIAAVLRCVASSPDVDATIACWWIGEDDRQRSRTMLDPIAEVSGTKPIVVTSLERSRVGTWTAELGMDGVAFCGSIGGAARGLRAMREMARPIPERVPTSWRIPRPDRLIATDVGPIVPFSDAMTLLERAGVPIARWWTHTPDLVASGTLDPVGSYVVKLADVAHRTELGAVRVGIDVAGVDVAAAELVAIAHRAGVPDTVVVQPRVRAAGEAFVGVQTATEVGDVIVAGLGGILVESTRDVVGRILPVAAADVAEMLEEFGGATVFAGLRGAAPWDRASVAAAVSAAARVGEAGREWLASMDINPLMVGPDGVIAVDVLMVARPFDPREPSRGSADRP